jgi:hypothetical protein
MRDNIEMDLIELEVLDWICLAQHRNKWQAVGKMALGLWAT